MSELAKRVVTAGALLIGILAVLFLASVRVAIALTGIVMLLAAWEWSAFPGLRTIPARLAYTVGLGLLLAASAVLVPAPVPLEPVLWLALAWWGLALLWVLRYPTPIPPVFAGVAGILVIVPAWLAIVSLLCTPGQGPALTLLALSVVFAADIGAYFAGHRYGRVKLAPQVSPGKTWEGLFGGVLLATATAGAGGLLLQLPPSATLPIGLGVAALSVVGDLTESMFKRNVGSKDSGRLIPGHGGILDRLDSITAAMPLFALAMSWMGRSPG